MNWLLNLAIRTKLLLAFGLMLALIAVLIAGAYWGLNVIQQTQKTLFERDMVISMELVELRAELNQHRSNILIMLLESQRAEQEALEKMIIHGEAGTDQRVASLTMQGRDEPTFVDRLNDIKTTLGTYRQTRQQLISMIYDGQIEQARELSTGIQRERFE